MQLKPQSFSITLKLLLTTNQQATFSGELFLKSPSINLYYSEKSVVHLRWQAPCLLEVSSLLGRLLQELLSFCHFHTFAYIIPIRLSHITCSCCFIYRLRLALFCCHCFCSVSPMEILSAELLFCVASQSHLLHISQKWCLLIQLRNE